MRARRKNIEKTLQSIQMIPSKHQNLKLLTQNCQPCCFARQSIQKISIPAVNDDKGMRVLRRYRYKQAKQQQNDNSLNKHKSLQLARRNLKRSSEHRLNQYNSIQNSPYKVLQPKKSSQKITINQEVNTKPLKNKILSRQNKKFSIPKKISVTKLNQYSTQKTTPADLKQKAKIQIKLGKYQIALRSLQKVHEQNQTDIQLLDLKGTCLMNLKKFQDAMIYFSRVLMLDKYFSKKTYISLALCENQLNNVDRCVYHIDQCISLFPDFYQSYYFKGKLLYKQKMHDLAIDPLLKANQLNPSKREIRIVLAQCFEQMGNIDQALKYYKIKLDEIDEKNLKLAIRYGYILIKYEKETEAIQTFEKCLQVIQKYSINCTQKVEIVYKLALSYFHTKNYDLCVMKGQQLLNSSHQFTAVIIKILMACKIMQQNYYGSIQYLRRLDLLEVKSEDLKIFSTFSEGILMLMKKKTDQGIQRLQYLALILKKSVQDEFNIVVYKNYRLFLIYAYFILGKYSQCLQKIKQQQQIGLEPYIQKTIAYNSRFCSAMIKYNESQYFDTKKIFQICRNQFPQKFQIQLYSGLLQFKIYFILQNEGQRHQCKKLILSYLSKCLEAFKSINNNFTAHLFYYRGLFYAWQNQWALSICDLDYAIEKSQDNFYRFYYLRAIVLANLQNYKQAINDASIALSINEESPEAYLLRARCLQIDGNPSQAFADLQSFIALRPEDKQIHKFAGHLLFQNGAFEDALQAYSQGDVKEKDFQVHLTRSKTYFLLGKFQKSAQDMLEAYKISNNWQELEFDYRVIKWLGKLFSNFDQKDQQNVKIDKKIIEQNLVQLNDIYEDSKTEIRYGKIFKIIEFITLKGLCYFYIEDYEKAIDSFIEVIELKKLLMQGDQQGQFQQQETEKIVFINQMYFNLALCCCMLHDYPNAERYLRKCQISPQVHNYEIYQQLLDHIKGTVEVDQTQIYLDVFSLRNKLSKYLPKKKVPFLYKQKETLSFRAMKLCIPYPKVQPPEINPNFDNQLIDQINLNEIERRTDAPWIFRQKNSIKFTDRIDVYSRFQMQKSEIQHDKKHHMGLAFSNSSLSLMQHLDLREQLKLDTKLEEKLNKLIKKQK